MSRPPSPVKPPAKALVVAGLAILMLAACAERRPPINVEAKGAPGHTDWSIGLPF